MGKVGALELIDTFFEETDPSQIGPRSLVWCPIPNLDMSTLVLEAKRIQDTSHTSAHFRAVSLTDEHFSRRPRTELPVLNLKLGETEEALLTKAKRRPCVVIARTEIPKVSRETPPHQVDGRLVVAPIYDIATSEDPKGFREPLVTRIRHLQYRHLFPIDAWKETRPSRTVQGATSIREGVLRLDRIQLVAPKAPMCTAIPLRLGEEAWTLLAASLAAYLGAAPSKEFAEMVEVLQDCLPKEL